MTCTEPCLLVVRHIRRHLAPLSKYFWISPDAGRLMIPVLEMFGVAGVGITLRAQRHALMIVSGIHEVTVLSLTTT